MAALYFIACVDQNLPPKRAAAPSVVNLGSELLSYCTNQSSTRISHRIEEETNSKLYQNFNTSSLNEILYLCYASY